MSLDKYEFSKGMGDFGLGFSEGEIQTVFNYFDANKNGLLEYDEFLRAIRGPMNPARRAIVAKAFAIMDKDGNGYLDYNDIKGVYSASKHPDVISGKKTEQQILQEFLETFEAAHNMRSNEAPDHIVTKDEFDEYYNNVSASIDRDDYFAVMMNSAWNLDGSRVKKSGWSNTGGASAPASRGGQRQQTGAPAKATAKPENMNYSDKQLCEVMRKKLAARGARGI
jgi:Ca2+-binding EF-hand superfamily protein